METLQICSPDRLGKREKLDKIDLIQPPKFHKLSL